MTESLQAEMTALETETRELDWVVNRFVDSVPGAARDFSPQFEPEKA